MERSPPPLSHQVEDCPLRAVFVQTEDASKNGDCGTVWQASEWHHSPFVGLRALRLAASPGLLMSSAHFPPFIYFRGKER